MIDIIINNSYILTLIAFGLGLFISFITYKFLGCNKNMALSIMFLSPLVCIALLTVNGNIGASVAILGIFSLVRFRSIPGTSKDIVSIFYAMVVGLVTATGYIISAISLTLLVGILIAIMTIVLKIEETYILKILIPEGLNFEEVFNAILNKHFAKSELVKAKTTDLGALFELTYKIVPNKDFNLKACMDELRIHNGNLTITYVKERNAESL